MDIIKVKMTKDQDGSPDGVTVRGYKKNETVDLPESLANAFCDDLKVAKRVTKKEIEAAKVEAAKVEAAKVEVKETPETPAK